MFESISLSYQITLSHPLNPLIFFHFLISESISSHNLISLHLKNDLTLLSHNLVLHFPTPLPSLSPLRLPFSPFYIPPHVFSLTPVSLTFSLSDSSLLFSHSSLSPLLLSLSSSVLFSCFLSGRAHRSSLSVQPPTPSPLCQARRHVNTLWTRWLQHQLQPVSRSLWHPPPSHCCWKEGSCVRLFSERKSLWLHDKSSYYLMKDMAGSYKTRDTRL